MKLVAARLTKKLFVFDGHMRTVSGAPTGSSSCAAIEFEMLVTGSQWRMHTSMRFLLTEEIRAVRVEILTCNRRLGAPQEMPVSGEEKG